MKKIVIVLFLCMGVASIYAGNPDAGGSGLSFMKIGVDARATGMGEAYTAVSEDASAVYWNPAGLLSAHRSNVMFNHTEWLLDIRSDFLALSLVGKRSAWGFHLRTLTIGDIEVREIPTIEPLEYTSAQYFSAGISYARRLHSRLDAAISIKYLFEKIFVENATGFALDLGVKYRTPLPDLTLGFTAQNLGKMSALRQEQTRLPILYRFGIQYHIPLTSEKMSVMLASDAVKVSSESIRYHLGGEVLFLKQIALRGGLLLGYESRKFSMGLGFRRSAIRLDYGYLPFSDALGNTHSFTLNFII